MTDSAIPIKDQAAHLRTNGFWIGRTYSDKFVRNLYDLASRDLITAEQWNTYGDASKSWDKQSRAILMISKTADPAKAASTEEKAAVLKINGYWIDGKAVGKGVIDNLYTLHTNGKITSDEWNKLGAATLPWDKQSASITSRLDRPVEPETDTPPVVETPVEEPPALDIPEEVVPEEAIPAVVEETVEEEAVPAVTEEAVPEEVSEEDQQATDDVAGDDGISKQAEELDAAKMTEQELRDALTNDPVLRLALRRLAEQGLAKNSEGLLRIIDEVECAPADTAKPAPAPAEPEPEAATGAIDEVIEEAIGTPLAHPLLYEDFSNPDMSRWEKAYWTNDNPLFHMVGWSTDNAVIRDGKLSLRLDNTSSRGRPYTSGEFRSRESFGYGTLEASIKAAKGDGVVTSLFFWAEDEDEIDIEILGADTTKMQTNYFLKGQGNKEHYIDLGFDASESFNTYAIKWEPDGITWLVNGNEVHREDGARGPLPSTPGKIMVNLWPSHIWGNFEYQEPLYAHYDWIKFTPYDAEEVTAAASPAAPTPAREPAPAPAEPTPPATPAAVDPADALRTTAAVEELPAEEKQKQISELLELRENVKNVSWYKECKNPTLLPKSPRTNNEFKQLRKERINEIDEQIRALDPQAVPSDSVFWNPWTWDMFNK